MERRRDTQFLYGLSWGLIWISALGAGWVLLDPIVEVVRVPLLGGAQMTLKLGGTGFSDQLKGAVVSLILVSGFAAVIGYWLGASNTPKPGPPTITAETIEHQEVKSDSTF